MAQESAIELELDTSEIERFLSRLQTNKDQITKRDSAYISAVSVFVFQDVQDHFRKEQGSDGKWAAWSSIYSRHMQSIGKGGNQILQDSGRLRQSFTPGMYRATSEGIEWYNPAKTADGFPYAYAHDEGGPKLPRRDFMWLSESAMNKISEATLEFLVKE